MGTSKVADYEPDKLDEMNSTLKEILKWTRFANISKLKEVLEHELDDDQKKLAYDNSDGKNGLREISAICGAHFRTLGGWWEKWNRLGLVTESETRKGRMMKIATLDEIGIKVPKKAKSVQTEGGQVNQKDEKSEPSPEQDSQAPTK
jgi:hypothetical protein